MLGRMDEANGSAPGAEEIAKMSFEDALAALEGIVQQLEAGNVPLDKSITLYERGEKLRAACQDRLDKAQARIEQIVGDGQNTARAAVPFDKEG